MDIFNRTRDNEIEFGKFLDKVDNIYKNLKEFENEIDLFDIASIKKSFRAKTDDFFSEDRKLNIGIIGRVKVGKSSFLNTLMFGGRSILPAAVTPKTAVLTRIEYDAENRLDIEYFTYEEWKLLNAAANGNNQKNEYKVAHEITTMVKERNLNPEDFIKKQKETIYYDTYEELMESINDYVGENGKYTPLVKSVSIFVDREELEDISIVDTPGLYDPILSRVDKTKQFMELCDVVFFLSKSTSFLDKNDIDLVASQLPKKGVKKVVLVCSRFDDGLRDTLWSKDSLEEAVEYTKKQLCNYAEQAFTNYKNTNYYVNGDLIEQFKKPVFVSAIAENMAMKGLENLNSKEKRVYEDLISKGPITTEQVKAIGNMDEIRKLFKEVIEQKDVMLKEKASSFIPVAKEELDDKLMRIQTLAKKRINQLSTYDKEKLSEDKKVITSQINKMNVNLEVVFNELKEKIEQHKMQAISEIRAYNREYLQVSEKEGITTHFEIRKESNAKWFKPWTWGTTSRVIYSYDERYQYIDAYDAIENIRNFVEDGKECIELAFNKSLDIAVLKNKLLSIIIENLDALGENFDASYYKLLVEKTLNGIKIPNIEFPTTPFEEIITSEFTGEIKSNSMKSNFKKVLSDTIYDVREGICNKLEREVMRFEEGIDELKKNFAENLLTDINKELNAVIEQFENKEIEIQRYNKLIEVIDKVEINV
ncbi:MAG: dynamin family protein [Lachnospiraceae bacterium]|nr:dynamin family protein [Lachnospiraceae bacterium]